MEYQEYVHPTQPETSPRIRTSGPIPQLSEALCAAQKKFTAAIKGSTNPHLGSKYADISSVIDATLEHLNAEGISLTQHPSLGFHGDKPFVTVTTRLQLKDQWMESDLNIPATVMNKFDPQTVGIATTYGCRYAMTAILVVPRADAESDAGEPEKPAAKAKVTGPPKANIPPSPFSGRDENVERSDGHFSVPLSGMGSPSVEVAPLTPRMPTTDEMKGFLKKARLYSKEILPKFYADGSYALKRHILEETGVSDVKNLTFQQWTGILDGLDDAERSGILKGHINAPLFAKEATNG